MQNKNNGGTSELIISFLLFLATAVFCVEMPSKIPAVLQKTGELYEKYALFRVVSDKKEKETINEEPEETTVALPIAQAETQPFQEPFSDSGTQLCDTIEDSTPDDLKKLQEEYKEAFSGVAPAGEVTEVYFTDNGATDQVGNIYIKNTTKTKKPDYNALLQKGAVLSVKNKSEPTVLIFHTHTTESYLQVDDGVFYEGYQTRSEKSESNMVRVGNEIENALKENGIGVIHDTNIYDTLYDGAYDRSRQSVLKYLEQYPSIQIVLDVHRDAIYYSDSLRCKPTVTVNGKKAAQIMIITGAEEGQVTSFPNWEDNLRFALCIQQKALNSFKGLMKPIFFCQRRYNMDTAKCSLLIEVGTDANTLEEACYSARLLGKVLSQIVEEYSEK